MVGNTIQTVNSPMYEYIHEYSWKHSEARSHTQQHTDSTKKSAPGWERTYDALVSILLSQLTNPLCQSGIFFNILFNFSLKICEDKF